jgi:hypothetical protein
LLPCQSTPSMSMMRARMLVNEVIFSLFKINGIVGANKD